MSAPDPPYRVDAADKALQLVLLLRDRDSLGVAEAAEQLGVARSTAHRLLVTLRHREFAVQSADRRYRAGPALRRPTGPRSTATLVALAAPLLGRLRDEVEETVHLLVLDGADVVFLHSAEGRQPLRVGSRVGVRLPAAVTSGGKVLLAALPAEDVDARHPGLVGAARSGLHRSLAAVRAAGFGLNEGSTEPGISAVGVPVHDDEGRVVAALTVTVPATRLPQAAVPPMTAALRRTAAAITTLVG